MKYVDYVLCKRDMNYHAELFVAPAFSGLKQGDLVVVEPERKDMIAKVLGVITIEQNDIQSRDFVLMATKTGAESDLPEVRNFKFLKSQYNFTVLENETPVILCMHGEPICAGRLDLVLEINGETGLADIKRTSTLDKDYLALQLNLYRIAYCQSYGICPDFLRGIHLRDDVRKFVTIPINEQMTWQYIKEWMEGRNE